MSPVDFYSRIYREIILISRKENNSEIHKMKVNEIKLKHRFTFLIAKIKSIKFLRRIESGKKRLKLHK